MKEAACTRVTVVAGGLKEVTVNADFTDLSVSPANKLKVLFADIVRNKKIQTEVNW